jgi:predicted esterase
MSIRIDNKSPTNAILAPQLALSNKETSWWDRITQAYFRALKGLMQWLEQRIGRGVALGVGSTLSEPISSTRAGLEMLFYNCFKTPRFSGVNPETLSPNQLAVKPVLCLHGNYHGPSAFTDIAAALKEAYDPGIFTVQLPHGPRTEKDTHIINAKLKEIRDLYEAHGVPNVKIDLVGHSRGADLAFQHSVYQEIGKVVLIGAYCQHENETAAVQQRCLQINGANDCLTDTTRLDRATQKALTDPHHSQIIDTGHLKLIYHSQTHQSLIRWLKP